MKDFLNQFLLEIYKEPYLTKYDYIKRSLSIYQSSYDSTIKVLHLIDVNQDHQISLNNDGLYYVENYLLEKPIEVSINIDSNFIYLLKILIGIKNEFGITKFRVIPE